MKERKRENDFFDIFGFLHDALQSNIRAALAKRGGFSEVISLMLLS